MVALARLLKWQNEEILTHILFRALLGASTHGLDVALERRLSDVIVVDLEWQTGKFPLKSAQLMPFEELEVQLPERADLSHARQQTEGKKLEFAKRLGFPLRGYGISYLRSEFCTALATPS